MRTKRAIIFPAVLTFATLGSILAGSALPLVALSAPAVPVAASPGMTYHG